MCLDGSQNKETTAGGGGASGAGGAGGAGGAFRWLGGKRQKDAGVFDRSAAGDQIVTAGVSFKGQRGGGRSVASGQDRPPLLMTSPTHNWDEKFRNLPSAVISDPHISVYLLFIYLFITV